MPFHYLFGDSQANACARVLLTGMETLKYLEYAILGSESLTSWYFMIWKRKKLLY
jgi:hypothetical protein